MIEKSITLPNGDKMPVVGLGTFLIEDANQVEATMETALKNGYRHFDTAYTYRNEHLLGKVIERWISYGLVKREELFITTKLPMNGVHPDRVEMFINKSLKNLRLEYVDLYLIHFPICTKYDEKIHFPVNEAGEVLTEPTDHIAVWKKMEEQVTSGKARSIGLSNFNEKQISKILEKAKIKPANLQIEMYIYMQNNELANFCREKGISIVAYSPLGCPQINEFNKRVGLPIQEIFDVMSDPFVVTMAKKYSKSQAQIMLRFLIQRGVAVIPKSVTPLRIEQNIDIFNFELDENDMMKLRALDKGRKGKICDLKAMKGIPTHPEYPF